MGARSRAHHRNRRAIPCSAASLITAGILNLAPAPQGTPIQHVVLRAELSDGYHSVEQLKDAETITPSVTTRSAGITTSSAATTAPITEITIPETAQPGYYDLTFSIGTDGAVLSGSTIIRVEAAGASS